MSRPGPEELFQGQVIDLAHLLGWAVAHFAAARTAKGFRTPVRADGKGFPDLVLVRERLITAELKSEKGRLRPEQRDWQERLGAAGVEHHLWRPGDLEEIQRTLARREAAPA